MKTRHAKRLVPRPEWLEDRVALSSTPFAMPLAVPAQVRGLARASVPRAPAAATQRPSQPYVTAAQPNLGTAVDPGQAFFGNQLKVVGGRVIDTMR
jgi:hypothetical protein